MCRNRADRINVKNTEVCYNFENDMHHRGACFKLLLLLIYCFLDLITLHKVTKNTVCFSQRLNLRFQNVFIFFLIKFKYLSFFMKINNESCYFAIKSGYINSAKPLLSNVFLIFEPKKFIEILIY